ncbi:MAG: 30S ribosomal protein S6e [Nanoarchaeota archaeon]
MATFKLVIGTKEGKSYQKELNEEQSGTLVGRRIGDTVSGDEVGLAGYEFEITGGSDYCGFPMRKDAQGPARKKILAVSGVGLKKVAKGLRYRKTVAGNTVHDKTAQVNLKVLKAGNEPLTHQPTKKKAK